MNRSERLKSIKSFLTIASKSTLRMYADKVDAAIERWQHNLTIWAWGIGHWALGIEKTDFYAGLCENFLGF
ncbi:hypothetical protein NIES37_42820 [Tolypothrix tenuis PCC 7101]|uniref:Uncharacterized protein n=1 Tax=Tolypothrix tenuis PCC 7101 TaxID=231146 RepID=A0A1Z4N3G3_9CYAN|nr:hypothetical protein [Aulosira sp. FACHB-113]BAZ00293.1 hypothetical protein NIES37_42820 [Tolypothrix tenuis PCC 7101]BAZ75786.1 hypothetical protein NIES50_43770 [Aulosira laxa NIES-50]